MQLVAPDTVYLASYAAALARGWSADNLRPAAATEELAAIESDPRAFLDRLNGRAGIDEPITLPDGSQVPRLPGFRRWMWDGDFCGSIGIRWQPGTAELPPHVLGHIGYAVVPWKRQRGYATQALGLLLPQARDLGLPWVDLTTDPDNLPSQKVIVANGGTVIERFCKGAAYDGAESLRFRIRLAFAPD